MPSPADLAYQEMHVSDTLVPNIIAVNVICFTIACVAVALRFLARRMARIRYEADDWLILVALVRGIPLLQSGFGFHVEASPLIVLTRTVLYPWSRRVRFAWYVTFPVCIHYFTDNEFLGVRYGSGRHVILLKDPAALGKVRTSNRNLRKSRV